MYDNNYCAFCENDSSSINSNGTPFCESCREIYEAGQAQPDVTFTPIAEATS